MLSQVDCFISPSRFTLQKHLEMGLEIPITHIPYFLPTPSVEDNLPGCLPERKRPYFLFVGRLEKIKGVQNLIPVFKKTPHYDLLIAGDGEYRKELEKLAEGVPNVKFLGKIEQNQLRGLYRRAIAVIVPSICLETFGIIIIEAFSMKTPVIVNNLGALPEVVRDSEGGGFIYNNPQELTVSMMKLAENPELRVKLGNQGYQAFVRYWNEDAHLARYFGLIERLQNKPDDGDGATV